MLPQAHVFLDWSHLLERNLGSDYHRQFNSSTSLLLIKSTNNNNNINNNNNNNNNIHGGEFSNNERNGGTDGFLGMIPSPSDDEELDKNYIALFLLIIPVLTIFGNALVLISVFREKSLQTTTNFLIASLAVSDFLVALCVMPFAVYVVVENSMWNLPKVLCNIYIAADVCASTASILNLVAVSWDRYIAVSRPIEYVRNNKNNLRVKATIFIVWFLSITIALPVVTGLNDLEDTEHCEFTNATYIVASSLGSFYLPCVIMVILYAIVLKNLRRRRHLRRKQNLVKAARFSNANGQQKVNIEIDCATTTESNVHNANYCIKLNGVKNHLQVSQNNNHSPSVPSRTESSVFDSEFIPFIDAVGGSGDSETNSIPPTVQAEYLENYFSPSIQASPELQQKVQKSNSANSNLENKLSSSLNSLNKPKRKLGQVQVQTYKNKESKQIVKETKATQTLAIVLGVFLLCWLPFFICHLTNSICMLRYGGNMCIPIMAFFLTTWLGYMNSFMNPVIYTVFNAEYRKAFYNILIRPRPRPV